VEIIITQAILSYKQPGFYEEQELSINFPKEYFLEIINKTDESSGVRFRKQNIYTDRKLNNKKSLYEDE
jgi:hypothetical protein